MTVEAESDCLEQTTIAELDVDGVWRAMFATLRAACEADRLVWAVAVDDDVLVGAEVDAAGSVRFPDALSVADHQALPHDAIAGVLREGRGVTVAGWTLLPMVCAQSVVGCMAFEGAICDGVAARLEAIAASLEKLRRIYATLHRGRSRERELSVFRRSRDQLQASLEQSEAEVRTREAELEEAQRELVRKERLATLGQLIATVSHELRNPLGTVRGSVFIISQRLLGKDLGVERALDRAERNIVRCDRIIEDLLDYTRTSELELQPVNLDRWLEIALEEYLFPANINVHVALEGKTEALIEPERLRRCLINLLNNACDALKDRETRELWVHSVRTDQRIEIGVRDSGCGIPEENLEKIFEPLFSTKSFGVGLGLPTVHQVMEQHGGGLEIESREGEGTTAVLWLPLEVEGAVAERQD